MNFTIEKDFLGKKITSFLFLVFVNVISSCFPSRHVYSCPLNYLALNKGRLTNTRGVFFGWGECVFQSFCLLVCLLLWEENSSCLNS